MKRNRKNKKGTEFQKLVPSRGSYASQERLITAAKTLQLLASDKPTKEIAQARKTTHRNINKLFKSYRERGYINAQRELTKAGKELIKKAVPFSSVVSDKSVPQMVRLHDLQFNISILKKPKNWDKHRTTITRIKKYYPRQNKLKGGAVLQDIVIDNLAVRVTPKSFLVRPPDIFEGTPQDAVNIGMDMVLHIIPKLENLFSVKLEKERYPNIIISRQHHAFIFHPLARWCQKKGIQLQVRDKNGELRIITDDSRGLCELEAIHTNHAEDDATFLQGYFEDLLLKENLKPSELTAAISKIAANMQNLTGQINELAQGQINNTKQMGSTIDMIKLLLPKETKGSGAEHPKQEKLIGYR